MLVLGFQGDFYMKEMPGYIGKLAKRSPFILLDARSIAQFALWSEASTSKT